MEHSKSVKCNDMTIAGKIVSETDVKDFVNGMKMTFRQYDSFSNSEDWECTIKPTGEYAGNTEQVELTIRWN